MGFDPYDALGGTRVPSWALSRARARQVVVQLRRRLPVDLAPTLGIQPRVIVKALACFMTAESRLAAAEGTAGEECLASARDLACAMQSAGGHCGGGAWGYEFDVQTRWGFYAAGSPNLIATVFAGRGFAEAGSAFGVAEWLSEATMSAHYIVESLMRTTEEGRLFFAYTPDSPRLIHNANLLGAGIVATLGAVSNRPEWIELGLEAAATSIADQRQDGSWAYGEGRGLGWSDNFHTAYDLDGLLGLWLASGDTEVLRSLKLGLRLWVGEFFGPGGEPKYYLGSPYPHDIHSGATAVDVAGRLATWGFPTANVARKVERWTRANLIDHITGHTCYQKWRWFTDKRHFVRWGDAHWALGQSSLSLLAAGRRAPFEAAVAAKSGVIPLD